jgi:hypothetical protein
MKSAGMAQRRGKALGRGAPPRHVSSHARLLRDVSTSPVPSSRSRRGRPDAIIVPATRPASALTGLIELAADLEAHLVVLCSRQAKVDQVGERVARVHRARALVMNVDDDYRLPGPAFATSSREFIAASSGRSSDLSLKRNIGLLLARLRGWRKIVFVDDDITLRTQDIARLTDQLDSHQMASMVCRDFPDNSVFCHARRLAKLQQDVFATGAVLGVHCGDLPLPFFPDIYNEDWFFFGDAAAQHQLTKAGEARQAAYDPFAEPARASHEEFGDLLAEGLYNVIENHGPHDSFRQITDLANERYWSSFIDVRRHDLDDTRYHLEEFTHRDNCSDNVTNAIKRLEASDALYRDSPRSSALITPARCVDFLEAWREDISEWGMAYPRTNNLGNLPAAMDWLQVQAEDWQAVGCG